MSIFPEILDEVLLASRPKDLFLAGARDAGIEKWKDPQTNKKEEKTRRRKNTSKLWFPLRGPTPRFIPSFSEVTKSAPKRSQRCRALHQAPEPRVQLRGAAGDIQHLRFGLVSGRCKSRA